jgi:hypothetical protein
MATCAGEPAISSANMQRSTCNTVMQGLSTLHVVEHGARHARMTRSRPSHVRKIHTEDRRLETTAAAKLGAKITEKLERHKRRRQRRGENARGLAGATVVHKTDTEEGGVRGRRQICGSPLTCSNLSAAKWRCLRSWRSALIAIILVRERWHRRPAGATNCDRMRNDVQYVERYPEEIRWQNAALFLLNINHAWTE